MFLFNCSEVSIVINVYLETISKFIERWEVQSKELFLCHFSESLWCSIIHDYFSVHFLQTRIFLHNHYVTTQIRKCHFRVFTLLILRPYSGFTICPNNIFFSERIQFRFTGCIINHSHLNADSYRLLVICKLPNISFHKEQHPQSFLFTA